ncbi:26S proteasome regulatory subunit N2 [Galdieria sulphuraria]|uniref:26S proteasome regulatory subunit N2 n=1 Tax=Galdieria sulphuraria TaxID=130081 RepID=M2Y1J8_GALSU|nr:26S proteasome regulatory subunit N2 [Galdieria sulphuraria]EME29798.1 26S proteasome regulatory subunit N2 [Galdieria sulphuraria]|eukprot:XP_005706318.1 26S proteasome regulatory subunit N2 [Galdieria sulphuraria]
MSVLVVNSASSALNELSESEPLLQVHALRVLNSVVDYSWPEISSYVPKIQALSESPSFPEPELAALVAAKVLFYLGDIDQALEYALMAGDKFDVTEETEFSQTLRSRCIDLYVELKSGSGPREKEHLPSFTHSSVESNQASSSTVKEANFPVLERVVEDVFDDCLKKNETFEAVGIAIECRRLDKLKDAVATETDPLRVPLILDYCFRCSQGLVASKAYRTEVLYALVELYEKQPTPDYVSICKCLGFLEDAKRVAEILVRLLKEENEQCHLSCLQIALDLFDSDSPHFSRKLYEEFSLQFSDEKVGDNSLFQTIRSILNGTVPSALYLEFLYTKNHSENNVLKKVKQSLDARSSVNHTGLVLANGFMNAGTKNDAFLRENIEWLSRATNWAKFSATACLGLIHTRQASSALTLLSPYLSNEGGSTSAYAEGGALYALGLIVASASSFELTEPSSQQYIPVTAKGLSSRSYLLSALRSAGNNEVIQHGACLGIGLACMGMATGDENDELYEELKGVLYSDSAVAGQAAAFAIGLILAGSGSSRAIEEMLAYAHDTQHEKITRALAVCISLIMYGREEDADTLIDQLCDEKDPILRYSAMFTIGLAYCGTGENKATRRLLHVAVSDVNEDVRRAAVISLGFVLIRQPLQVPKIVKLLSESYHAHVRYGAAMAIGIACACTGSHNAIEILEHLSIDTVDFVRQAALIALSMVLMQQSEGMNSKVADIRRLFDRTISDKHEEILSKFGAVLATGIINAGGKNCTIEFISQSGYLRSRAILGMTMFCQFWHWYPAAHFLSLSFRPAALIALTKDLKLPKMEFLCEAKPSMFDYVKATGQEQKKEEEPVVSAVLSVSTHQRRRDRTKKTTSTESKVNAGTTAPMELDSEETKRSKEQAKDSSKLKVEQYQEPTSYRMENPSRVLPQQIPYVRIPTNSPFKGLTTIAHPGFLLVQPKDSHSEVEFVSYQLYGYPVVQEDDMAESNPTQEPMSEEPQPPAPFEYHED